MINLEDETACWTEPGTGHAYPLGFEAYRRTREAEERRPPRHQGLGVAVDRHVWDRWRVPPKLEVEVLLTMRPDAPPRVRRMATEILRAIRRGSRANDAIRRVSKRFGLRQARVHACLEACLGVQLHPVHDELAPSA